MAHPAKWTVASPDEPVTDVARRSLQDRLAVVEQYLPLAALNWRESLEYVHGLRVASRRAEAALDMYRELVPDWRRARLQKQLRKIRSATNAARDDDVFIARLEADRENKAAVRLARRVREHRESVQPGIEAVYQRLIHDKRLDRRIHKLVDRVRLRGKKLKARKPDFREWAIAKFSRLVESLETACDCDTDDLESLHQLRITAKKVRYGMELLAEAFPPAFRSQVYPKLEKLQEKLGRVNDHFTAGQRIRFWIREARDARKELNYLQEVQQDVERQLEASCLDFRKWWDKKRGPKLLEELRNSTRP